jgi:Repeat of unknown function (DUF346)
MAFQTESRGGHLSSLAPEVVSWGSGRLDVFGAEPSGQLRHWWFDHGWNGPEPLAGTASSEVALRALSWGPGRIDLFGANNGRELNHRWWPTAQGIWGGPEGLPYLAHNGLTTTAQVSSVSAASWRAGRLDVFSVLSNANEPLHHYWWPNNHNSFGLETLGESVALGDGGVSAVSWGLERLDAFAIYPNEKRLRHWWYELSAGWASGGAPEFLVGHGLKYTPNAVSWGPHRLDVFAIGSGGDLQHWWWPGDGAVWGGPQPLGSDALGHPPVAVSWGSGRLDAFAARDFGGGLGQVVHWWFPNGGQWGGPEFLPGEIRVGALGSPAVSVASWGANRLDVFGVGADASLRHWWID